MSKISTLAILAVTAALASGSAIAAPQYNGTGAGQPGSGGENSVDCSDIAYANLPYCQLVKQQDPAPVTITGPTSRTNSLNGKGSNGGQGSSGLTVNTETVTPAND